MPKFLNTIAFIVFLLFTSVSHAQVVSSINHQNMKVPTTNKPDKNANKQNKQSKDLSKVPIDTTTLYYQLIDSAQTYIKTKDWSNAESCLRKAIVSEPSNQNNSLLLSNIATLQRYQGKLNEAVKNYTLALDMTPNAVTLLKNRAALYLQIDSVDLARKDYDHIINIDPSDEESHYNLGMLALESNDYKAADQQFEEILRYNPNSALSSKGKAFLNKGTGNYAKAAQYFSDVIKVDGSASLLANRADCYLMIKRLSDAADDINSAIQLTPDDGYLYLLRAKLKKLRYENEAAEKDVQLAIQHGVDKNIAESSLK